MSRPTGAFLRMSKSGRSRRRPDARTKKSSYARDSEELLPDARVAGEVLRAARERDAARLEDAGVVGESEGVRHILLDEEDGDACLANGGKRGEHFADEARGKAESRLVEEEEARACHEAAADRAHLLLSSRERAGFLGMALLEHREHGEDLRERARRLGPRSLFPCPHLEVLENRHARPELTRLGHEPVRGSRVSRPVREVAAVEQDASAPWREKARDRLQESGLPGAVRAHEREDLAGLDAERNLPDGLHVSIGDVEALDGKEAQRAASSGASPKYAATTAGSRSTSSGRPSAILSPKFRTRIRSETPTTAWT